VKRSDFYPLGLNLKQLFIEEKHNIIPQ